jgi:NTE family protein
MSFENRRTHLVPAIRIIALTLTLFFVSAFASFSQDTPEKKKRPRIGLVLEGGGALGFAHIGVLQWLEDHHIPVDFVAGTSMGGLVGGLYASGESPEEINNLVQRSIDWDDVLSGESSYANLSFRRKEDVEVYNNRIEVGLKGGITLPGGLNLGHNVTLVLDRATLPYSDLESFDDLPIPFRCVAVDLTAGKEKVFDHGALSRALRATMSIPGVFAPAVIDGHSYSDGGVLNNLPVDVAKSMGADIVIAVYLDTGPEALKPLSLFGVAGRNVEIVIKANELRSMKAADILINAPVAGFGTMDFEKSAKIIPKGVIGAEEKKAMLEHLSLSDAEWAQYLAARNSRRRLDLPVPKFIEVTGTSRALDDGIQRYLNTFVNKPIDPGALEEKLNLVRGTGRFQSLGYQLLDKNGQTGLLIRASEKLYGPPFLNFAITIDGSDPADVRFGVSARVTKTVGSDPRTEWRTDFAFGNTYGINTELYRPFSVTSRWFVAPHAGIIRNLFDVYDNGQRIAQYTETKGGFGLDLGYSVSRFAEFRLGEDFSWLEARRKIGISEFPNFSVLSGVTKLQYIYYGQDDAIIPRRGLKSQSQAYYYTDGDNGKPYPLLQTYNSYFHELSPRGSLFLVADGGTAFGHTNLGINGFNLGGPLRLGAYGRNELVGNQFYLFQAGYLRQIAEINPLFGEGIYAGAFYEIGKVYDSGIQASNLPMDGSVVIIVKTALGPAFVGGSVGSNGQAKWWFGLSRVF